MRIAYVCADPGIAPDGHKGAAVHVRSMVSAFARAGHDVDVFSMRSGMGPIEVGVTWHSLMAARIGDSIDPIHPDEHVEARLRDDLSRRVAAARFEERLRVALERVPVDVIYERHSLFGSSAQVAAELGVPRLVEVNAPLSDEQERYRGLGLPQTARDIERTSLTEADAVAVVSSATERWVRALGVPARSIVLLPNAVDERRFDGDRSERQTVRARLKLGDAPVVGFVGSLRAWHDVDGLLDAVALIRTKLPDVHLMIVGGGRGQTALEQRAEALGLHRQCRFVGAVDHPEVPSLLAAMDVGVAPYAKRDDLYFSPLKLFEYLAAELPTVVADVGDVRCCVEDANTGWLYVPGDVDFLADATLRALTRPDRKDIARAGRAHVLARHTWSNNARRALAAVGASGSQAGSATSSPGPELAAR